MIGTHKMSNRENTMLHAFQTFLRDESGATTVDWVLLTAGIMSLTLAVMSTYGDGAEAVSNAVSSTVAARPTTITW
jgi:Flp pilus assembly pilin Flp